MASTSVLIAVKLIAIVIATVSIIANGLVCHVIVRLKSMKTSINYIILNLAILDAISGILMINTVILNDKRGVLGEPVLQQAYNQSSELAVVLCRFQWSYWIVPYVTPYILTAMAYERYRAILYPLSTLHKSKTKLKLILALAWVSGFGYTTVDMIIAKYDSENITCIYKDISWFKIKIYATVHLCSQIIIPSIAMFVFYSRIIYALRRQDKTLEPQGNMLGPQAAAERARRKTRKKVVWIIIVVTLVFYVCYVLPRVLSYFSAFYGYLFVFTDLWREINKIIMCINSAFNPFVYFVFIQSFRNSFKRIFMSRNSNSNSSLRLNTFQTSYGLENVSVDEQGHVSANQPKLVSLTITSDLHVKSGSTSKPITNM